MSDVATLAPLDLGQALAGLMDEDGAPDWFDDLVAPPEVATIPRRISRGDDAEDPGACDWAGRAPSRVSQTVPAESIADAQASSAVTRRHSAGTDPGTRVRRPDNPAQAEDGTTDLDWSLVVELRRRAVEMITGSIDQWRADHQAALPELDRRLMGRSVVRGVVRDHVDHLNRSGQALWPLALERTYARAVEDAIFGFGRLQPLFEIADAENIEIHGWDHVSVQFGDGRRRPLPPVADSDDDLVEAIRFLGQTASPPRPFDDAHPMMTLALGDRFRLHAMGFGLTDRPSIVIRQHLLTDVTLDELVATGMLPHDVGDFLTASVRARLSLVISGDQGAGKTTLLRALIAAIPPTERFGTLETDYELLTHLHGRANVVALQARVGLGERQDGRHVGEYTVADLIPEALRQNLMRLVVGEVRGAEAGAMFEAMQAGAGTMSTTHAHSALSTIDRLAARVALGGVFGIDEAYRQIAHNLDLILHVCLMDDTWRGGIRRRYVDEIRQVTGGFEGGRPITALVYQADGAGQPAFFRPDAGLVERIRPFATMGVI